MATITAPPWYYVSGAVWTRPDPDAPDARCIAKRASTGPTMTDLPPTEKDANLRLCAATPDMLAALKATLRAIDIVAMRSMGSKQDVLGHAVYQQIQKAIAKAGEA